MLKTKECNLKQNAAGEYVAVAYTYKCLPTGLFYCGATVHENQRKNVFRNINYSYGGKKINDARKEYQNWDTDWTYTRYEITAPSLDELIDAMDQLEQYLIRYHGSLLNGYNSNGGGLGRGNNSRILVKEKDGSQSIFESCESVAATYTMSVSNVYHYAYKKADHRKKNGMIFLPIDDETTMSALPPDFFTTYSIELP